MPCTGAVKRNGARLEGLRTSIQIPGERGDLGLIARDLRLVLSQPLLERQQRWIELSRPRDVAGAAEQLVKISLELKHVGKIRSARR